jgi:DNA-binding NarL/FixJ family response regulator
MNANIQDDEVLQTNHTSQKILIVDDHDHVRTSLRTWLGAVFPKYEFLGADSGEYAIALAEEHEPCLVLMDIGLPGMNGFEAAHRIMMKNPETKIAMLSLQDESCYREVAGRIGANAFVPKSKISTELIPVVTRLLLEIPGKSGRNGGF